MFFSRRLGVMVVFSYYGVDYCALLTEITGSYKKGNRVAIPTAVHKNDPNTPN